MVKFRVNGTEYELDESKKLMGFLRDELKLKSVKDGCSQGACGTCSVLVNGRAMKCCVMPVTRFEGAEIITVEGLSEREKEVYVYAFGEAGAVQCGFCIPGMVICAKALLDANPNPNRAEIAFAIRNNLCRCTGYKKIIDAIEIAAKYFRENLPIPDMEKAGVGTTFHRVDVKDKVLGTGEYVDDIELEGMIYASAVRSEYPRARVLSINTEEAAALPGVVGIYTAKDIPGNNKVGHLKHDWDTMIAEGDITRYVGDAICIVAAETKEILDKAKSLVRVDYEVLEPVTSPFDALKEDAPLLHEGGNIMAHEHLSFGDADAVIASSAYKVTRHYETPFTEHAFMEPEAAVAFPFEKGVFIYSTDQSAYDTRRETAIMLGIPEEDIVVENKLVGGGFGGKEDVTVQHLAALVAYLSKRPVKIKLSREESMRVHPKRHPMSMDFTTACDENGYLTAMKAVIVADTGAYASLGGPVLQRACTHAAGPYNYHNIDIDGKAIYTNNPPAGAFRGFGVTQTCFATECNINLLAEMVGISPWEIRYRNAIRPGQVLPNGQIADDSTGLVETLEAVKPYYDANPGAGIACALKNAGVGVGLPDKGRARLVIDKGRIHVYSGASCIGQGLWTVLTQILCETIKIPAGMVEVHPSNTATSPDSGTTSGSRQTLITGEAVREAAISLIDDLGLNDHLSGSNEDVDYIREALYKNDAKEYSAEFFAKTDKMGADVPNPVSHIAYGYATQVCILDEEDRVKQIVAAHEVGRAIQPKSVEGQIEGGVIMSCGYALTEDYRLENGVPKTKFGMLGLFRADIAPDVQSIVVEKAGIKEAYGAIGIGEITSIPTAPAIQAAYYYRDGEFRTSLPLYDTAYRKEGRNLK